MIGLFIITSCEKEERTSKMAGILEFDIPGLGLDQPFVVNQLARTVYNSPDSIHYATDIRALKATFGLTPGSVLKVGDSVQVSGVTVNDFRNPITYTVVAEDGKTVRNYTVRVIKTLDPKAVSWQKMTGPGFGRFLDATATVFGTAIYTAAFTPAVNTTPASFGMYYTNNGATWIRVKAADNKKDSLPLAAHGRMATFQNKLWLLGGLTKDAVLNKIWSSEDGTSWTVSEATDPAARWSPRERLNAVVFQDKLWVIGGSLLPAGGNPSLNGTALNDVWNTADGVTWTKVTAAATFPPRSNPAVFVYKDRIWLTGGIDNNQQYLNDVWNTADGVTWTKVAAQTPPPARNGHKVLVNKAQLLLIGGADNSATYNDLWVSADDGLNWAKITDPEDSRALPADFPQRAYFDAFTSNKVIWILGGQNDGAGVQEVWRGQMN
ncbi:Kelch repeat-containing protein [Chitinophaga alhagiae]|uniref:Kelch repeat-containing protein n=1 Tax=Chitinophaga alhagiae TaxID=2203219 RepID=UPI0013003F42|nr:DUF6242 domain-containing protein [Chitinophaga alhagiae]